MHLRGCPSHPLPWAPRALRPMHPHRRPLGKLSEHPNRSPGAPCPMRWVPLAPPRPPSPQQVPGCPSHAPLAVSQCVPCPEHPDGPPTLDTPISTSCVPGPSVPQQAPPAQTPLCPPPRHCHSPFPWVLAGVPSLGVAMTAGCRAPVGAAVLWGRACPRCGPQPTLMAFGCPWFSAYMWGVIPVPHPTSGALVQQRSLRRGQGAQWVPIRAHSPVYMGGAVQETPRVHTGATHTTWDTGAGTAGVQPRALN